MATFLIALFSVVLVLVCLFVTLLVLMQKPSANSGMGAALGGGAAEQAFGGEATNVLTRGTIYAIIAFFVLSFGLYLGTLANSQPQETASEGASITDLGEGRTGGEPESAAEAVIVEEEEEEVLVEPVPEDSEAGQVQPEDSPEGGSDESVNEEAPLRLENLDSPNPPADS